ncbi:reverse transcriptase domain-containing protein, partial [Tanacetum coccineum]
MVREGIILGYKVLGAGIEVDRAKIDSIAKLSQPTNIKAIRSFLGHAGFYQRFIKDFSQVTRPLTQLLVKDAPFIFSDECVHAFEKHKQELTQSLVMIKPDWSLPFEIMCDTSDYAVGVVLGQRITSACDISLPSKMKNLDSFAGYFCSKSLTSRFATRRVLKIEQPIT